MPNNEHQLLAGRLASIFHEILDNRDDVWSLAGANVSDQAIEWTKNFRCPDVVVVLPGSKAQNRHTHWFGGPDLVVEIVSEGDASYEKFDFYSKLEVREALIVDRDPWSLEIYRLDEAATLTLAGRSDLRNRRVVHSDVLNADMRLIKDKARPKIEVTDCKSQQKWLA
jgi:Uma2 family endonuclease